MGYILLALLASLGIPLALQDAPISGLPPALVAGVPAIVAIPLLVEGLKAAGLASKYAPLAAMAMGVIWMAAAGLALPAMDLAGWVGTIVVGPVVGLSAVGAYSAIKAAINNDARQTGASPPPAQPPSNTHV